MLMPVDGKNKPMYVVYGDELTRRASHPEYMTSTALTRVIHKDSIYSGILQDIIKNMIVEKEPENPGRLLRNTTFTNFLEGNLFIVFKFCSCNLISIQF